MSYPIQSAAERQLRPQLGAGDIDGLDPAFTPGTGTPEIGGLTSTQGLEIIRERRGLDLIWADLVEVSPPLRHHWQHGAG